MNHLLDDIVFATREDARDALDKALEIAETYGHVTLADIKDIARTKSYYVDNKLFWQSGDSLTDDSIILRTADGWIIRMPENYIDERPRYGYYRDYAQRSYRYSKPMIKPDPEPQPLYITVNTESIDDVDETLANLFKYIYTITDRVVNISIV